MNSLRQSIAGYRLNFDASQGSAGRLHLLAADGAQLAEFGFVASGALIPPPRLSPDGRAARGFLRLDALPALLEILRPGNAPFLQIDTEPPGHVSICSGDRLIDERVDAASPKAAVPSESNVKANP